MNGVRWGDTYLCVYINVYLKIVYRDGVNEIHKQRMLIIDAFLGLIVLGIRSIFEPHPTGTSLT